MLGTNDEGRRLTGRWLRVCVLLLVLLMAMMACGCVAVSQRGTGSGSEAGAAGSSVEDGVATDGGDVGDDADASDEPPSWPEQASSLVACDLDGDGLPEVVEVGDGRLRIYAAAQDARAVEGTGVSAVTDEPWMCALTEEDGRTVCAATEKWRVSDCLVGDVDHDGIQELVLLAWVRGTYGSSKPLWKEDDDSWSQHVYLLHYDADGLSPVWMSSALHFEAMGIGLDGSQRIHTVTTAGEELVWAWDSWGLTLVDGGGAGGEVEVDGSETVAEADATSDEGSRALTLVAVGDNLMHWSIVQSAKTQDGGYDFAPLYAEVAPWVSGFDLAVVGQEAPLLADAEYAQPVSGAPFLLGDALASAGFDVVLNATNHVGDFGDDALAGELAFWESSHSEVTALGIHGRADEPRYALVAQNGVRLALFNYTQSTGRASRLSEDGSALVDQLVNEERLVDDLATAEDEADLSVCFLHTGPEGKAMPDAWQVELCERLVDAGADVIVCAHAHEVMPFRRITTAAGNAGVVYYGLGNFVSNSHGADVVLEAAAALTLRVDVMGGERAATVETAMMVPLVCQLDGDGTRVVPLATYTDELADANYLLADEDERSAETLRSLWTERCLSASELTADE